MMRTCSIAKLQLRWHVFQDASAVTCMCAILMQVVCITDPVLATQVLRSKVVDKLRFQYSFLDPVRA